MSNSCVSMTIFLINRVQIPLSGHPPLADRERARVRVHIHASSPMPSSFIPHPSSLLKANLHSTSLSPQSLPGSRKGFTLFEVLLTLCLLVIIAAIVWPSLERSFSTQRLRKAADQIRTGWCKARIKAMTTGYLLVFRYEIDGGKYRLYGQTADGAYVQTAESAYFALTQATPASSTNNANYSPDNVFTGTSSPLDKMLPDGIAFVGNETLVDQRAAVALNNISNAEAGWSDPIFFYPDGTTSTARLLLRNKDYRMIELFLRGLTGVVTVGDVTAAQELLP